MHTDTQPCISFWQPMECAVVPLFFLLETLRLAVQNSSQALSFPNAYFLAFIFAKQHNSLSASLCHPKAQDIRKSFRPVRKFFVSSTSAASTANLVLVISSRSARISWVAASSRLSSLRLLSAFSLTISVILSILFTHSNRSLASISSCKRSKRFFVDRVEICLPLAFCGTSTSSQEGSSILTLCVFFVLQTHSTCLVGGSRSCGLGAPGCSSQGLLLAARMVEPNFV